MPASKTTTLKNLLQSKNLSFLMEAHDGISAKIVEEAGFEGVWGSGLCLSAAMGVRDCNEATWTQVLEVVEFMNDIVSVPILLDADTGYGDFNILRRVVRKLEQRDIAGLCIEDKVFPKTNSFVNSENQDLAPIDEFCGKIKAAKDTQSDPDFCVVARVEAFIAGWGLDEALKRAYAYYEAGADAILVHSKKPNPQDIVSFMSEWHDTCPVVIVPTKYYSTPTEVFRDIGISTVIWANHVLRAAVTAMQHTAKQIFEDQALVNVEDRVAPVAEVFRLQGQEEIQKAESLYLPPKRSDSSAIILAASRGEELQNLTEKIPKAMLPIRGRPLIARAVQTFNSVGIKRISVVRGYLKDAIDLPGLNYVDNDEFQETKEVYSLYKARDKIEDNTIVCFGDTLFKEHIVRDLLEGSGKINIAVDFQWTRRSKKRSYVDYVACNSPYDFFGKEFNLLEMSSRLEVDRTNGEWIGLFMVKDGGELTLRSALDDLSVRPNFADLRIADLFNYLVEKGHNINVVYVSSHWIDVDDVDDFTQATIF